MTSIQNHSSPMEVCRVCAEKRSEMLPIFSELDGGTIIASVITECATIQIWEDDGLSEWICSDCVGDVKIIITFIDKARQSDRLLRKMFKTEMKQEEDKLYALEISVLGHPEEVDIKNEPMEEEVDMIEEKQEEMEEFDPNIDFDDDNDSDFVAEDKSDSDEDYQPKRKKKKASVSSIPKTTKTQSIDDLDEIEKSTFTIEDVGEKLICCTCYKLFDSKDELKSHGKSVHEPIHKKFKPSKKHICQYCFRRYASPVALKAHRQKAKSFSQVFKCQLCEVRFTSSERRRQHAHKHPPIVPKSSIIVAPIPIEALEECGKICCALGCTRVFETEEELLAHAANAHKANKVQAALTSYDRPVECQICYRRFIDENGLKAHQQRIYMPKRHVCSICGLKFSQPGECKRHERDHLSGEKAFKCEQCPKKFSNLALLNAHIKRHTAPREHMCNLCGQSYLQKANLLQHMLMHEGKLPFECEICQKGFRMKAKLIYHQRVHSGERPFPCRYCNAAFADSTNRMRHEMSHTGIKPYKCDFCEKTFITKRLKKEHENTHTGNSSSRGQKAKQKTVTL